MQSLGREADAPARVYFTGGATAVLFGWRDSTIDVDIRIAPETDRLLRAIPLLKESLRINVELASPLDFIPVPAGWEDRSPFIAQERILSYHHFDLYAQALSKVERSHAQDLNDVETMIERGLVVPAKACDYFERIAPELYRYPAIDPASFARAAARAFGCIR